MLSGLHVWMPIFRVYCFPFENRFPQEVAKFCLPVFLEHQYLLYRRNPLIHSVSYDLE